MRRTGANFVLGVIFVATMSGAWADDFLNKEQLLEFFTGRVVDSQTQDGVEATFHFDPDGKLRTFFNRPKNPHWSPGTWWVTDIGTLCTKNDKDETLCHKIRRDGNTYVRFSPKGTPIRGKWAPR